MAEKINVFLVAPDGSTKEITDSKVCMKIADLFTANYLSDGTQTAIEDSKLVEKLSTGKSVIRINRTDDEDKSKNQTVEIAKSTVKKYVDNIRQMLELAKVNSGMKKVSGSFGKRGRTSTATDYDGLND